MRARPVWESRGRAAVVRACKTWNDALRQPGARLLSTLPADNSVRALGLEALALAAEAKGQVTLIPAYFCRLGGILDLPDALLIAVRAEGDGPENTLMSRGRAIATEVSPFCHPIGSAILSALGDQAMATDELAEKLGISKPRVRAHVARLQRLQVIEFD